jgi:hypothetical protein
MAIVQIIFKDSLNHIQCFSIHHVLDAHGIKMHTDSNQTANT